MSADLLELARPYKRAPSVENAAGKAWPRTVRARFIEPGLVNYDDLGLGMILVRKPFLDKVRDSFVGKPVIDMRHKDARPENFQEIADGVVIRAWHDAADGWDWCEFLVWDDAAYLHCKDPSFFVSCAYDPTRIDRAGGKHHNVEYDGEFLDGSYTHLAIVQDPRYEGARIVWNSTGGKTMNLLKLFSREEKVAEVDPTKTFIEVDGEKLSVENAIKQIRAANAGSMECAMKDDDVIEVDGKKYSGADVKNAIRNAKKSAKNAEEKGEKAGDQKEAEEEEEKEGKKRDKGEAKNAAEDEEEADEKKDKKEAKNSLGDGDEKGKHLRDFKETVEMRNNQPGAPTITTQQDRLKLGSERYGKAAKEAA